MQPGGDDREGGKGGGGRNADNPTHDREFGAHSADRGIEVGLRGGAFVPVGNDRCNSFSLTTLEAGVFEVAGGGNAPHRSPPNAYASPSGSGTSKALRVKETSV